VHPVPIMKIIDRNSRCSGTPSAFKCCIQKRQGSCWNEAMVFATYFKALNAEEAEPLISLSAKYLMWFAKVVLQIFLDLLKAILTYHTW
jgi:hypothetical protein